MRSEIHSAFRNTVRCLALATIFILASWGDPSLASARSCTSVLLSCSTLSACEAVEDNECEYQGCLGTVICADGGGGCTEGSHTTATICLIDEH